MSGKRPVIAYRKTNEVRAAQFDGTLSSLEGLMELLDPLTDVLSITVKRPQYGEHRNIFTVTAVLQDHGSPEMEDGLNRDDLIQEGCWLVRTESGDRSVLSAQQFATTYSIGEVR
jgi:hypothetical protein